MKPSERFKTARYLTRWELCLDILDQLAADVEALKRDRQYTGHRTAPIDDPSDPVHPRTEDSFAVCARDAADIVRPPGHPLSQAQPDRLEAWALTTLDGDRQGVWFERGSAEPISGEEVQHRLVELREGEQIVPEGSIVLTGEQLSAIKGESERALEQRDEARRAYCTTTALGRCVDWADPDGWLDVMSRRIADEEWGDGEGKCLFPERKTDDEGPD